MFAKHKNGHIFPIRLYIDALDTHFMAIIEEYKSTDEFVWFYEHSHEIVAASKKSMQLFAVRDETDGSSCCTLSL